MGRIPCCSKKEELNKGAWTAQEDKILKDHIEVHGEGKWSSIARRTGLKRCGKSCRLRWLNYLRPDIKRGNITHDEEDLIIRLHRLLGNRWSLIAGRLPGRTDNEIKNYWNTNLAKRALHAHRHLSNGTAEPITISENPAPATTTPTRQNISRPLKRPTPTTTPPTKEATTTTKTAAAAFTRSMSNNSLISNQTQLNAMMSSNNESRRKSAVTTNSYHSDPIVDHEWSPLFTSSGDELSQEYVINHHAAAENEVNDSIISDMNINAGFCDFNDGDLEGGGDIDGLGTIIDGQKVVDRSILFCDNNNEQSYLSNYEEMDQGFWGANVDFRSLTSLLESDHEEWGGGGDLDLYFQS